MIQNVSKIAFKGIEPFSTNKQKKEIIARLNTNGTAYKIFEGAVYYGRDLNSYKAVQQTAIQKSLAPVVFENGVKDAVRNFIAGRKKIK